MVEINPDFISPLPHDVIHAIFSFLPLKHAVKTSILSTVWRSLWMPIHVNLDVALDQIVNPEVSKEVTRVIATFLISCNCPRKLYLGIPMSEKMKLQMKNEWFLLATKVDEKELYLSFSEENRPTKDHFHLILEVGSSPNLENSFTEASRFASLKVLHLRSITHLDKNMVAALFSNSQLLEVLKLVKCSGLQHLDLKGGSHFQSFEMLDCPEVVNINLAAPKLKSFRYRGVLPRIQIKKASGFTDALLDFRDGPGHVEFDCEELVTLLKALKDVEILTLSGWLLEWMCSAGVIFGKLGFQFNKLKELWWMGSQMDRTNRDSLACFLNFTPSLERLFIDINTQLDYVPCPPFHHYWHEPHLWMDYAAVKCNALPLERLKTVFIVGFTKQEEELLLMDLLLEKASESELTSMIVKCPENDSWRVAKIPRGRWLLRTWIRKWFSVSSSDQDEWLFGYVDQDYCRDLCPAHSTVF
ncbi:F-box protein At2g39490-like [Carya illinoinensis]|uniref:F-box domain-containing protein n=1 Tax=Carya illinoinensis TaxID=32201 RepID=A0A8T1PNL9_CARIL|nr:F-box protein At2g39490-like [Carya illinoinensis]KAG6643111.1 hypothetical protein CIPAW_09G187700 [Carya illinoinensis]